MRSAAPARASVPWRWIASTCRRSSQSRMPCITTCSLPHPTPVGRRLAALEQRAEMRLFERSPEGWAATAVGLGLVARAEQVENEVLAAERELSGASERVTGVVRLTATEMLATRFIVPHLWRFREKYPGLTIDLISSNRPLDLARREADVALRLTRPQQPSIVARRLGEIELGLYGAPSYLERRGTPPEPERSLRGHEVILFAASRAFAIENEWLEARLDGGQVALRADSVSTIYSAVTGGVGFGLLPSAVADDDPALVRIDTHSSPEPRVVWQMVHRDLQRAPRIRAVLDFLGDLLVHNRPRRRRAP
ncbi:MAG: LysR family transcriptional regulator [Myxococcales bacterium]|nr:MAG: LysR family transcriptional regulator [Myxococcales bacterium]